MSENIKILLVDDEADIALALSLGLESNGFSVDTFTSSITALANFKSDFYKLALLDIKIPEMDGIELYKKIRDKDKKIKVCFVSAYDVDYHTVKEYSTCIIKKPITLEDLLKRINTELERNLD
ncbi:MAG TPA: response regulator [Nitrososphaeraceae archaeon]|jgi:DNA-binding response OmpR family regulator